MFRTILMTAAATVAFSGIAHAMDPMACDAETMAMVTTDVEGAMEATDETKAMAMKELEMAKMAMDESKADECSMHLGMAAEAVMKK